MISRKIIGGFAVVCTLLPAPLLTGAEEPIASDDFALALELYQAGSIPRAEWTREPDEPLLTTNRVTYGQTVWFKYIAPSNGLVTLSMAKAIGNTNWFYPAMAVFTGESLANAVKVANQEVHPRTSFEFDFGFRDLDSARWVFQTEAGQAYRIGIDREISYTFTFDPLVGAWTHGPDTSTAWGDVELFLSFAPAPSNDDFAAAVVLPSDLSEFSGLLDGATREPAEALIEGGTGRTLWYRWTAPAKGMFIFSAESIEQMPILAFWRGTSLTNLSSYRTTSTRWQACYTQWRSKAGVAVHAEAGEEFFLQVDSLLATYTGDFKFQVRRETPPANDNFNAREFIAGTEVLANSSNRGATSEAGEPAASNDDYGASVWYSWLAPKDGVLTISSNAPVIHPAPAAYNLPSPFDGNYGVVTVMPGPRCPWMEVDPDIMRPRFTIYAGDMLTSLVSLASGDVPIARVRAGERYSIQVDSRRGVPGDFQISFAFNEIPSNDDFAQAFPMAGGHVKFHSYFAGATSEPGEPAHAGSPADRSLWWIWTAPGTGQACLKSEVTPVGTRLVVYSGSDFASLTPSPQATPSVNSGAMIFFAAARGERYLIVADLPNTGTQTANLNVHLDLQMLVSDVFVERPGIFPAGNFVFSHWERAGRTVRVDCSGDLMNWMPVSTNQLLSDVTRFIIPQAAHEPSAFFRVVRVE